MPQGWFHIATQNTWAWLLLATAGVSLAVIGLLVFLLFRQRSGQSKTHLTPAQQRALERDIQGLVNDLAEMARTVGSQLDARAVRLEQLIREADDRLDQLASAKPILTGQIIDPAPTPSPLPAHPALSEIVEADPRHVEIYTLADQGLALNAIAERLRRPRGEVELILALRPTASRTRS